MTKIKITTTQNIDIEYELATLFERMLAWVIDFAILCGYAMLASLVVLLINPFASQFAYLGAMAPALLYHLVSEQLWQGKSVGKAAVGIRVVRLDGSPPNFFNYVLRWAFRLVETNPFLLYGTISILSISFSEKCQRVGDLLSNTAVIRTSRKADFKDTIFMRNREDYEPVFAEAKGLSDRDAATVREVLNGYKSVNDRKVMNACANRVAHVLHVVPPAGMGAELFLRTILRDYNHLN